VALGLAEAFQVAVELLHLALQAGVGLLEFAVFAFESLADRHYVLALEHAATFICLSGLKLPRQRVDLSFEHELALLHRLYLAGLFLQHRFQVLGLAALRSLLVIERLLELQAEPIALLQRLHIHPLGLFVGLAELVVLLQQSIDLLHKLLPIATYLRLMSLELQDLLGEFGDLRIVLVADGLDAAIALLVAEVVSGG